MKQTLKWAAPLLVLGLVTWSSCQLVSSRETLPVSARALAEEYARSPAAIRSKYDGKEITVSGTTLTIPTLPLVGDDQGSVLLEEKDHQPRVACWFSKGHSDQFAQVKAGQVITVKGVFNGEAGVELKFCKLVKIE